MIDSRGTSRSGQHSPARYKDIVDPAFFHELIDAVSDGVYFLDTDRKIVFWSRGAERLTGYRAEEVLGRSCAENLLVHVDCRGRVLCSTETCPAAICMREESSREERIFLKHKAGHRVPVVTRVTPILDVDGSVAGAAEVFSASPDTAATEARLKELERLALLDPLTGVGNRRFGERELLESLNETGRSDGTFGVMFIDIDGFKGLNDEYGHDVGDRVLKMVAQTLLHNVRSYDSVSRWGGEEFLLLLKNVGEPHLPVVAEKLRNLVASARLSHDSRQLTATISIGATMRSPGDTDETLVHRADLAMYESKRRGGNRVALAPGGPGLRIVTD